MSVPSEVREYPVVQNHHGQRLATSPEQTLAFSEVTSWMKLKARRYQAATKVNVLSPEITIIAEADELHDYRRLQCCTVNGKDTASLPGSEAVA